MQALFELGERIRGLHSANGYPSLLVRQYSHTFCATHAHERLAVAEILAVLLCMLLNVKCALWSSCGGYAGEGRWSAGGRWYLIAPHFGETWSALRLACSSHQPPAHLRWGWCQDFEHLFLCRILRALPCVWPPQQLTENTAVRMQGYKISCTAVAAGFWCSCWLPVTALALPRCLVQSRITWYGKG